jgi:hypothetical protein
MDISQGMIYLFQDVGRCEMAKSEPTELNRSSGVIEIPQSAMTN